MKQIVFESRVFLFYYCVIVQYNFSWVCSIAVFTDVGVLLNQCLYSDHECCSVS